MAQEMVEGASGRVDSHKVNEGAVRVVALTEGRKSASACGAGGV